MELRIAKGLRSKIEGNPAAGGAQFLQHKLAQTTLILEVLAYINTIMSKGIDFETFCFEICQILHGKFRFKYIHIWTIDEKDPAKLYLVTPEDETASRSMNIDQGIIGKAIRDKQMTCVPDVIIDPDYKNIHSEIKSELCVPLIYEGKIIGAINIETDTYQTFEGSKELIEVIAENLSCALKIAMLHKTEEQFHKLIEHMSEGVWVGDKNDCTVYTNPAFRKMIGFSEEELRGKISYDYFDEKSKEIIRLENEKRRAGLSSHYNAVYLSKNGDSIPVIIHAVPFGNGGSMATVTDLRDIKKTEWKLRETENYLAAITQYCPEAIVALNENTIVQSWNEEAERMFGYKAEEAIGQQIKKLIIPEDKIMAGEVEQIIGEVKIKGFMRNYETIRIHKNGKPLLVALTASSIKDENGRIIGFAALYRDITIQKKWEHELQDRFEKMQDAYKEMGKQRRYLDYLIEIINMAASTTMSVKQIATFVVNAIVIISKVDAATLRLLDKETGKLILVAQSGLNEDWWSKKTLYYNNSLLKSAVGNGHPLKILDILNNPLYSSPALARKNNLRSALLMPLEVKGEVLGSLTLYLSNERDLNLLDDEFITIFAKQSSLALELAY